VILKKEIEQLYQVFQNYRPPEKIITFDCISCLNIEDEQYLLNTPLKEINDHIFGEIMESCNTIKMGNDCYKYYIPRILELTTIEKFDFSFSFVEYAYRDFAKFDYQNKFNEKEIKAIDDFFYSYLEQEFSKLRDERDESEIFDVAITGFNPVLFLEKIQQSKNWIEIKKQLISHIRLQETKWAKSKKEFSEWLNKGKRKDIIEFLNKK